MESLHAVVDAGNQPPHGGGMSIDEMRAMLDQAGVPRKFHRYQAPVCCQPESRVGVFRVPFWPAGVGLFALVRQGLAAAVPETVKTGGRTGADNTSHPPLRFGAGLSTRMLRPYNGALRAKTEPR